MRGARPISNSAVRRSPNSCTSSAPKLETPTSVTHTGRRGGRLNLSDSLRPFRERPVIPIQGKSMDGHGVHMIEHAALFQSANELGIDRRHPSENAREAGVFRGDGKRRELHHLRIDVPLGIEISKSQWDLLFGSFQNLTASIIYRVLQSWRFARVGRRKPPARGETGFGILNFAASPRHRSGWGSTSWSGPGHNGAR